MKCVRLLSQRSNRFNAQGRSESDPDGIAGVSLLPLFVPNTSKPKRRPETGADSVPSLGRALGSCRRETVPRTSEALSSLQGISSMLGGRLQTEASAYPSLCFAVKLQRGRTQTTRHARCCSCSNSSAELYAVSESCVESGWPLRGSNTSSNSCDCLFARETRKQKDYKKARLIDIDGASKGSIQFDSNSDYLRGPALAGPEEAAPSACVRAQDAHDVRVSVRPHANCASLLAFVRSHART